MCVYRLPQSLLTQCLAALCKQPDSAVRDPVGRFEEDVVSVEEGPVFLAEDIFWLSAYIQTQRPCDSEALGEAPLNEGGEEERTYTSESSARKQRPARCRAQRTCASCRQTRRASRSP